MKNIIVLSENFRKKRRLDRPGSCLNKRRRIVKQKEAAYYYFTRRSFWVEQMFVCMLFFIQT